MDEVRDLQSRLVMLRCIIVDDHGDTLAGYAEFFKASGLDVRTAGSAAELRPLLAGWLPDALVLDLQLPQTDGWQLTRELRADPRTRGLVIIAVSACVLASERAEAEAAGCDVFIGKPVDPTLILAELTKRLAADPDAR